MLSTRGVILMRQLMLQRHTPPHRGEELPSVEDSLRGSGRRRQRGGGGVWFLVYQGGRHVVGVQVESI